MRRTLALATLLTSLTLGPSPASAETAVIEFAGVWHEDCWGCGATSGYADLTFYGTHPGHAHATFEAYSTATTCAFTGIAIGHVDGPISFDFAWSRAYFTVAAITLTGGTTGAGRATWVPSSVTCGGPVDAFVEGTIAVT